MGVSPEKKILNREFDACEDAVRDQGKGPQWIFCKISRDNGKIRLLYVLTTKYLYYRAREGLYYNRYCMMLDACTKVGR